MTQDEIIRMAREVWGERAILPFNELKAFAALVAAHEAEKWRQALPIAMDAMMLQEREACAEVCDRFAENEAGFVAEDCAAAIRARSEK